MGWLAVWMFLGAMNAVRFGTMERWDGIGLWFFGLLFFTGLGPISFVLTFGGPIHKQ